jgi:tetratricopeptide (TPR) repeat protein
MPSVEDIIQQSDEFHAKDDVKNNFAVLQNAVENEGLKDAELDWRLARAYYQMADESDDAEVKKTYVLKANDLASSAVQAKPDNFATQKWAGIVLGKVGEFVSTKEKIANAYTIRDYFTKAIELNAKDATSQHCLGVWHWKILQIGMVERGIASMLFGSPPSTTYEECEKCLLASAELDANQVYNNLLLGDLYYAQRKWDEAKAWYTKAAACNAVTEHQKKLKDDATKKIAKC